MANVVRRKVKGKYYFYLETTVRIGKKFRKFYEYLGPKKPSNRLLLASGRKLKIKINKFFKEKLLKPKTEHIDIKIARKLELIKNETAVFLGSLGDNQRKEWLEREREKFITNTNAIEGSTLSENETRRILRLNEKFGSEREQLEVINMEKCLCRYDEYLRINQPIDDLLILQLHFILLNNVPDYDQYKGIWRLVNIFVRTSEFEFPHHRAVPSLMEELLGWLALNKDKIHAIELSAKFHCKLTTIHPFADGNGRMARLLMNYILQLNGFPFTNIPSHKREEYFQTQEEGHKNNYKAFTLFLAKQIIENYKNIKAEIKKEKRERIPF